MVELLLLTPGHIQDKPILNDVVDVNVPALLGLDVLDRNNVFVENVTGHLWKRVTIRQHALKYGDRWKKN